MKKTYKNPTLTVVNIQPAQFIATSLRASGKSADKSLGMSSRSSRFSDDDWDEE